MKLFKYFLLSFIIAHLAIPTNVYADCVIDNTTDSGPTKAPTIDGGGMTNHIYGQEFKACQNGNLNTISLKTSGGTINLFLVKGKGSTIDLTNPYESFTALANQKITLNLSVPFKVEKDEEYAFAVTGVDSILFDWYPVNDGQNAFDLFGGHSSLPMNDLFYSVSISTIIIPTFSEWGVFLFVLLLISVGLNLTGKFSRAAVLTNSNLELSPNVYNNTESFNLPLFLKSLLLIYFTFILVFVFSMLFANYQLTTADLIFAPLTGILICYIFLQLKK